MVVSVEKIVEGAGWKGSVFLINLGQDDWTVRFKGRGISDRILDFAEGGSEFRRADMGHDVGVMLEDQNFLGRGGIERGRSDSDNGSIFDVWEFQFNGKGVVNSTGSILKLELVGVLIKLENLKNLSVDIKISFFFMANVKGCSLISTFDVVLGEMVLGPFLEGRLDGRVLLLVSGSLSGESVWSFSGSLSSWDGFIGRIKSP